MLTTKRYEYCAIDKIGFHPILNNHRGINAAKVAHLETDILGNGLLEPLVVWERNAGEYYLVGGFHRMDAIKAIRSRHPGYFDRIDVRVVSGDPDEIKALNLKLNTDRVDTNVTDYFETVIYLNNANWNKQRIAEFLDKSVPWIEDIIRYAPAVNTQMLEKLKSGELSWNKARDIIKRTLAAPAGHEKEILEQGLAHAAEQKKRPVSFKSAINRFSKAADEKPHQTLTIEIEDILALIVALQGKNFKEEHRDRIKKAFPGLVD
jgi:ParB family transcriptional regulator, chromosome partitioning protein